MHRSKPAKNLGISESIAEPTQRLSAFPRECAAEGFRAVSEPGQAYLPIRGSIGRTQPTDLYASRVQNVTPPIIERQYLRTFATAARLLEGSHFERDLHRDPSAGF